MIQCLHLFCTFLVILTRILLYMVFQKDGPNLKDTVTSNLVRLFETLCIIITQTIKLTHLI